MHALENLHNEVRDPAARPGVREVIDAYCAVIISTGVSVSLDLVAKIRKLADQGDAAAVSWRHDLDAAITACDKERQSTSASVTSADWAGSVFGSGAGDRHDC